ncbi:hypothetical protein DK842_05510 [Chromobacterium phragmitis]|uniref:DUF2628 domain-containing protein n=1 Tax=Chromobacterium phragmitis TaxID=2202141 RepID=A0A344UHN2_9NEIS|nr:DUF2628 domain-containing protein [Chromobacterium phragmitis]AXE29406.1 hypothetical protein DK842_05510 [Chromobacterium phragmitis]AXE34780.1 hypothetical protein DK843_11040 [Chromobacterium phragmitis]
MSNSYENYKPKWQERFSFFDQHGGPGRSEHQQALKALPLGRRLTVHLNFVSLLFWPIHFLVLGLWRAMLSLLGIAILLGTLVAILGLPEVVSRGLGMAVSVLAAMSVNYLYYLKQVRGQNGWNPFAALKKSA